MSKTNTTTEAVAICTTRRGGMEIHKPGCRDIARKGLVGDWIITAPVTDRAAAERKIEAAINHDFARDAGLSIDAYLDAGHGYRCGRAVRIFPCAGMSKS